MSLLDATRARIARSSLAGRFLGGAAWSVVGAMASSCIALITMIFVARLLGKQTYGQFVIVQSTLAMVGVFAGFGIGTTSTRYVAELRLRDPDRLSKILALMERTALGIGIVVAIALALMSGLIASTLLKSPEIAPALLIAATFTLFSVLDGYCKSVLVGLEAMRPLAVGTVLATLSSVPIMLLAAEAYGLNGIAGAMALSALIQVCISRFQMVTQLQRFAIGREARGCLREWRVLRDVALPAVLAGGFVIPAHWICQTMLANEPDGFAELALLGIAMQWFNVILFLPNVAGRVVLPILTDHLSDNNLSSAKRLLYVAIGASAFLTWPVAFLVAGFSTWIIRLYGAEFHDGSYVLVIAVLTAALLSVQAPVGNVIIAVSRIWTGALMNLGWAIVYVAGAFLLLDFGSLGVLSAMGIAYVIHAIWTFAFANSLMKSRASIISEVLSPLVESTEYRKQ